MCTPPPCLLRLYRTGLQACHGRLVVREKGRTHTLQNAHVLALGKAAVAMSRGVLDAARMRGETLAALLAISRDEADFRGEETAGVVQAPVRVMRGDHPVPGARSLAAGHAAFTFVRALPAGADLIVLLSGGASALCEHLQPGCTLAGLQAATRDWLAQGWDIGRINQQRRCWSQLKAGGLRRAVPAGVRVRQWLIADVPGADPAIVGSAPFLDDTLPTDTDVIASAAHFAQAIRHACPEALWENRSLNGDSAAIAGAFFQQPPAPGTLTLWQGEATVRLPGNAGKGGRAQHLALQLALQAPPGLELLVAATDGSDGNTDAAGVHLNAARIAHVQAHREWAERALTDADSHHFWRAHGGLLYTGATGSNVMDVVLATMR